MYTVEPHTAQMTGAFWFIVTEDNNGLKVEGTLYYDDRGDAEAMANRLNHCPFCGDPLPKDGPSAMVCERMHPQGTPRLSDDEWYQLVEERGLVHDARYHPSTLLAMLDDIANGVDDHDGMSVRDVMHDIIADIVNSYSLAMKEADFDSAVIDDINNTVNGYIANHYGDN